MTAGDLPEVPDLEPPVKQDGRTPPDFQPPPRAKKLSHSPWGAIGIAISPKGGISVYGLQAKWPVTLYQRQWRRLLAVADSLAAFISAYQNRLPSMGDFPRTGHAIDMHSGLALPQRNLPGAYCPDLSNQDEWKLLADAHLDQAKHLPPQTSRPKKRNVNVLECQPVRPCRRELPIDPGLKLRCLDLFAVEDEAPAVEWRL
jgi:hypothetical protein